MKLLQKFSGYKLITPAMICLDISYKVIAEVMKVYKVTWGYIFRPVMIVSETIVIFRVNKLSYEA